MSSKSSLYSIIVISVYVLSCDTGPSDNGIDYINFSVAQNMNQHMLWKFYLRLK